MTKLEKRLSQILTGDYCGMALGYEQHTQEFIIYAWGDAPVSAMVYGRDKTIEGCIIKYYAHLLNEELRFNYSGLTSVAINSPINDTIFVYTKNMTCSAAKFVKSLAGKYAGYNIKLEKMGKIVPCMVGKENQ